MIRSITMGLPLPARFQLSGENILRSVSAEVAALIAGGMLTGGELHAQVNDGRLGMNRPGPPPSLSEARVLSGMSDANILEQLMATHSVEG
jgi:hypothetical protein